MTKDKYYRLREQVQKIEEKILAITGDNVEYNMEWTRSQRKCEQVEKLIWKRKHLLNKMFVATPEEVVRMEQVNNRLYDLTQKMYARTEAIFRKVMTATYDPESDDDVEIEGTLKFSPNGYSSVLPMANDDYYGSNFYEMLCIIGWLYTCDVLDLEEIEQCRCYLSEYRPEMSSKELRLTDDLNDGTTWYESVQPAADKLSHLCICHAIHDLSDHKPYSIPDILRMNDFWVEVTVKHQLISSRTAVASIGGSVARLRSFGISLCARLSIIVRHRFDLGRRFTTVLNYISRTISIASPKICRM